MLVGAGRSVEIVGSVRSSVLPIWYWFGSLLVSDAMSVALAPGFTRVGVGSKALRPFGFRSLLSRRGQWMAHGDSCRCPDAPWPSPWLVLRLIRSPITMTSPLI